MRGSRRSPDGNGHMKIVRLGIIGAAFGAKVHAPAFKLHPGCQVSALCSRDLTRARETANAAKIPLVFNDWRALIDSPEVDAISIATPPSTQVEIARYALERKKPVFAEKPLACTVEQANLLAALARSSGAANMVDFEFMDVAAFRRAKAMVDEGAIGRLCHLVVNWHVETYANRLRLSSWKTDPALGGGALFAFVSHVFYNVEVFAGPVKRLNAGLFKRPDDPRAGDTLDVISVECATGATGSLTIGTHSPNGSGHRMEFYGEEGSLFLHNPSEDYIKGFRLSLGTRKSGKHEFVNTRDALEDSVSDGRIAATSRLTGRFVEWVAKGQPARPNFEVARRVQHLMDAAQTSALQGKWIDVAIG